MFLDYSWLTMGTHVFKQHHTQTITCITNYVCSDIMTAVEKMLKVQFFGYQYTTTYRPVTSKYVCMASDSGFKFLNHIRFKFTIIANVVEK